jgi:signal transduction histidine kinase
VSRLRQLMDELLEYGRPFRLETTPESLRDVVTEAASACSLLASKQGVCVANDVQRGLPLLDVDRRRLTQVFQNLIENAIQHSPHGSVIRASGREVWRDGHCWLECAIDDAGPGFESEDLARLFEPFFTRRPGGVGLGLSIVQRIVTAHGGSVHATNRGEGGARMLVQLAVNGVAPRGEAV